MLDIDTATDLLYGSFYYRPSAYPRAMSPHELLVDSINETLVEGYP